MPDNEAFIEPIITIDGQSPDAAAIEAAARFIRGGKPVIYPTHALYGLGVDAADDAAIEQVFAIKGRSRTNPLSVLINRREDLRDLVKSIPPAAEAIMDRLWPGGVTLVFEAADGVSAKLTAGTGKIGIRLPEHPAARALLNAVKIPITATSANRSGGPACQCVDQLPASVLAQVSLVLDAGPLAGGPGSTVVDVTVDPPAVLRPGTVAEEPIRRAVSGSA